MVTFLNNPTENSRSLAQRNDAAAVFFAWRRLSQPDGDPD